jgi:hypothetical protein
MAYLVPNLSYFTRGRIRSLIGVGKCRLLVLKPALPATSFPEISPHSPYSPTMPRTIRKYYQSSAGLNERLRPSSKCLTAHNGPLD